MTQGVPLQRAAPGGRPPLRLDSHQSSPPFVPHAVGLDWWEPGIFYTGTTGSVTGLPNQRAGGLPLDYAGLSPAVITEIDGRDWILTPAAANKQQRFRADAIATTFGEQPNAPFTLALSFDLAPSSPTTATLFTLASTTKIGPQRLTVSMAGGFIRLITVNAEGVLTSATTQALLQPGDGPESLVIVARKDGTASVLQGGVLINDNLPWVRPALPGIDQCTFGALAQGRSIAQVPQATYGAFGWMGDAVTEGVADQIALYLRERFH